MALLATDHAKGRERRIECIIFLSLKAGFPLEENTDFKAAHWLRKALDSQKLSS